MEYNTIDDSTGRFGHITLILNGESYMIDKAKRMTLVLVDL